MKKETEEIEIDLLKLAQKLWSAKKIMLKCSIIGAVIGIIIAFSIPKEYTTTVILTTESVATQGGGVGALASIAGINLNNSTADIFSPAIYPEVLTSTPFLQGLLNIKVVDDKQGVNTTLDDYIRNNHKKAWWSYIIQSPMLLIKLFKPTNTSPDSISSSKYFISQQEMNVINHLRSSFTIATEKKTGITTIEISTQSPQISSYLADTLTSYLQDYIIEQRTQKSKSNLLASEKLYQQSKESYYTSQKNLAAFIDGNKNVISAIYKINQEKLQNEVSLSYSLYNQMAQQVQMNKIKIQDETPIFTIIQPAIEPLKPSTPRTKLIVIIVIFLSLLISGTWAIKDDLIGILFPKNS